MTFNGNKIFSVHHQLELISINGRNWVVDVGFGGNSPRMPLPGGEITLLDRILRVKTQDREEVLTLPDTPAYLDAVKTHFGISLDASYGDLKPLLKEKSQ